jgi:hypothetical protein
MKMRASTVFLALALVNFLLFAIEAEHLGGDAVSGRIVDGHCYLSSHGRLTEVSHAVFTYSRIHTWSVIASWPFVMLCALFRQKR